MNEIVTDLADLEYVYRKISAFDMLDAAAGAGTLNMKGRANQDDRDQVRQCQRHHTWSPMTPKLSSPLTLLSKRAFPVRGGSAANNESSPFRVSSLTHDGPTRARPLCSADFEDSDDEDDISIADIWEDVGVVPPLEVIFQCPKAEMRKIQLLLQAKVLREIVELGHEPGADCGLWEDAVTGWPHEGNCRREVSQ